MKRGSQDDQKAGKADREARLAAALRENLRRRKAQARGREAPAVPDRPPGAPKRP